MALKIRYNLLVTLSFMFIMLSGCFSQEDATEDNISVGHVSVNRTTFVNADTAQKAEMLCADCHGKDGSGDRFFGPDAMWGTPMIQGINEVYLAEQLHKYRTGERVQTGSNPDEMNLLMQDTVMTETVISDLSAYYANLNTLDIDPTILEQLDATEKEVFLAGQSLFDQNCVACHGEQGIGIAGSPIPRLAGQIALYTENRMAVFTEEIESNPASVMGNILKSVALTQNGIDSIAFYLENVVGKR